MTQPEAKIVKRIKTYLEGLGAWVLKIHPGEFQELGVPDLLVCFKGLFIAIEVKTDTGQLRPRQKLVMTRIREAQGIAFVARSVADVEEMIDRYM